MSIWTDIIKYIKIILVHPAIEIILNIIYLMSFLVVGLIIFTGNKYYKDIDILDMVESYLNYNDFIKIKTSTQLNDYIISTLDKLYRIDTINSEIPFFIPISPFRLVPYTNDNSCNTEIDYTMNCNSLTTNRFRCVIDNLSKSFKNKCGESLSYSYSFFHSKLIGHYSTYHLNKASNYLDVTQDSYSTHQTKINQILDDKRIKAIIMQVNLIAPSNGNYIDVVFGIEMTNYFTNVKTLFSAYVMNDKRPATNLVMLAFISLFAISKILSILKFIFEINIKCIWSIHVLAFLIEAFDTTFMILLILYLVEDKNLKFEVNLEKFESHLKYIDIIWFLKIFIGVSVMLFPFRFLSLISWCKTITEPLILVVNAVFRMFPGMFITLIFFFY